MFCCCQLAGMVTGSRMMIDRTQALNLAATRPAGGYCRLQEQGTQRNSGHATEEGAA